MHSAMLLQSMLKPPLPLSTVSSPIATPTTPIATPTITSTPPLPPTSSSFLQSLLNGNHHENTNSTSTEKPNFDLTKLEHVVQKLTKKHMGINARESYQCQICSKWFAVPPIKHLRGHLVTFKEEQRLYIGLINNNGFACLTCYHIAMTPQEINQHMAICHAPSSPVRSEHSPPQVNSFYSVTQPRYRFVNKIWIFIKL